MKVEVGEKSRLCVNLGDWISYFTYGVLMVKTWKSKIRELIHFPHKKRNRLTLF
jgi:hypothetical protein